MKLCKMLKGICDKCGDKETCVTRQELFPVKQKPPLTDIQDIIESYKAIKGVSLKDKTWDKRNFARFSRPAKQLLEIFETADRVKEAVRVIDKMFSPKGLIWNLATVEKWSDNIFAQLEKKQIANERRDAHKEYLAEQERRDEEARKNACPMPDEFKDMMKSVGASMRFPDGKKKT